MCDGGTKIGFLREKMNTFSHVVLKIRHASGLASYVNQSFHCSPWLAHQHGHMIFELQIPYDFADSFPWLVLLAGFVQIEMR